MLKALKYKEKILEEFYLDEDDNTIRRNKDGYHGRFKEHDIVKPYLFKGGNGTGYLGIHIPRTRETMAAHWVLTVLRGIHFEEGSVIDHKDGNPQNNTRTNLRVTTQSINSRNRVLRKDNKTGYPGINFNAASSLYIVRKQVNGSRRYSSAKTLPEAILRLREFEAEAERLNEGYIHR